MAVSTAEVLGLCIARGCDPQAAAAGRHFRAPACSYAVSRGIGGRMYWRVTGCDPGPSHPWLDLDVVLTTRRERIPVFALLYPGARLTIIYAHSGDVDAGQRRSRALDWCRNLRCNIVLFDYCGFGVASGRSSSSSACWDLQRVVEWVEDRPWCHGRSGLVLFGEGIGSGPCLWLASTRPLRGMILLGAPESALSGIVATPLASCADAYPNRVRAARVRCPVLIAHSQGDPWTPFRHGRRLAECLRTKAWSEPFFPSGPFRSVDIPDAMRDRFLRRIRGFLTSLTEGDVSYAADPLIPADAPAMAAPFFRPPGRRPRWSHGAPVLAPKHSAAEEMASSVATPLARTDPSPSARMNAKPTGPRTRVDEWGGGGAKGARRTGGGGAGGGGGGGGRGGGGGKGGAIGVSSASGAISSSSAASSSSSIEMGMLGAGVSKDGGASPPLPVTPSGTMNPLVMAKGFGKASSLHVHKKPTALSTSRHSPPGTPALRSGSAVTPSAASTPRDLKSHPHHPHLPSSPPSSSSSSSSPSSSSFSASKGVCRLPAQPDLPPPAAGGGCGGGWCGGGEGPIPAEEDDEEEWVLMEAAVLRKMGAVSLSVRASPAMLPKEGLVEEDDGERVLLLVLRVGKKASLPPLESCLRAGTVPVVSPTNLLAQWDAGLPRRTWPSEAETRAAALVYRIPETDPEISWIRRLATASEDTLLHPAGMDGQRRRMAARVIAMDLSREGDGVVHGGGGGGGGGGGFAHSLAHGHGMAKPSIFRAPKLVPITGSAFARRLTPLQTAASSTPGLIATPHSDNASSETPTTHVEPAATSRSTPGSIRGGALQRPSSFGAAASASRPPSRTKSDYSGRRKRRKRAGSRKRLHSTEPLDSKTANPAFLIARSGVSPSVARPFAAAAPQKTPKIATPTVVRPKSTSSEH